VLCSRKSRSGYDIRHVSDVHAVTADTHSHSHRVVSNADILVTNKRT